eukprot:1353515-Rhodomonas_salina.3
MTGVRASKKKRGKDGSSPEGVRAGERDDLLVVEAHAVEHLAQMPEQHENSTLVRTQRDLAKRMPASGNATRWGWCPPSRACHRTCHHRQPPRPEGCPPASTPAKATPMSGADII